MVNFPFKFLITKKQLNQTVASASISDIKQRMHATFSIFSHTFNYVRSANIHVAHYVNRLFTYSYHIQLHQRWFHFHIRAEKKKQQVYKQELDKPFKDTRNGRRGRIVTEHLLSLTSRVGERRRGTKCDTIIFFSTWLDVLLQNFIIQYLYFQFHDDSHISSLLLYIFLQCK